MRDSNSKTNDGFPTLHPTRGSQWNFYMNEY